MESVLTEREKKKDHIVVDRTKFQQQSALKMEETVKKAALEIKSKADQRVFRIVDGFETTRKEIAEIIRETVTQNYQRQKDIVDRLQALPEAELGSGTKPLVDELRSELDIQLDLIQKIVEHRFFRKFEIEEGDEQAQASSSSSND